MDILTLANNILKHEIILSNEIVSPITSTSYIFNSSTNFQHNKAEFKKLVFNSNVLN